MVRMFEERAVMRLDTTRGKVDLPDPQQIVPRVVRSLN